MLKLAPERAKTPPKSSHGQILGDCRSAALQGHGGRTCEELGLCRQLAECHLPCDGPPGPNRFPFAPGVIEGNPPGTDDGWVAELVAIVIVLGAVMAVLGFATGYLRVPGWSL